MIELKQVSKSYSGKQAIKEISLCLPRGEIVGLFGENGAGKTTLMKCILSYLKHEGEVLLDGERISRKNIIQLSFATSEHSFFPQLSAAAHREFYQMHFPRFSKKRFDGLMEFFSLPQNKHLAGFSMGQKNQFEVILALCQGADYILMDEPFAGNDIFNREDFYKVLMGILEPRETVILSTHLLEEVQNFISRAVLLHEGRIVGDVCMTDLEDSGKTLMEFVKETYHYRADRVSKALSDLTGEEEREERSCEKV